MYQLALPTILLILWRVSNTLLSIKNYPIRKRTICLEEPRSSERGCKSRISPIRRHENDISTCLEGLG